MVGEIRDSETAQIAVQSALTGHLMFTTIHANHALDVISRFQYMGVEVFNFASALNCIVAQRLVRALCSKCKKSINAPASVDLIENRLDQRWVKGATLFDKVGCPDCNGTGFRGRQAIIEFLGINDDIRDLITRKAPMREIKKLARANGMRTLRESAIEKVYNGSTTFNEINKITFREIT
jgi:type IV pilus assembly protein PilB